MEQVLLARDSRNGGLDFTGARYNPLFSGHEWSGNRGKKTSVVSAHGRLKKLKVRVTTAPGAGNSWTFILQLNDEDTALTVTIEGTNTSGEDILNQVTIAPGDMVSLQCSTSGTPADSRATWSLTFDGDTDNESIMSAVFRTNHAIARYAHVNSSSGDDGYDVETECNTVCPTAGRIRAMYVDFNGSSPGPELESYIFYLRVNGVNTALSVEVVGSNSKGNNVTNEIPVAAGDILSITAVPGAVTPKMLPTATVGLVFVADIAGEFPIWGGEAARTENGGVYYHPVGGDYYHPWEATESEASQVVSTAFTARKFYFELDDAPGAGNQYVFALSVNAGGASALTLTIANAATTGNDAVNSVAVAEDDLIAIISTPTGGPAEDEAWWGMVGYIAPPADPTPPPTPPEDPTEPTEMPIVATQSATNITQSGARLNGVVSEDNGFAGNVRFEYGLTTEYGSTTPSLGGYEAGDSFFSDVILSEGQAIHYRAVFTNIFGTVYGADVVVSALSSSDIWDFAPASLFIMGGW